MADQMLDQRQLLSLQVDLLRMELLQRRNHNFFLVHRRMRVMGAEGAGHSAWTPDAPFVTDGPPPVPAPTPSQVRAWNLGH